MLYSDVVCIAVMHEPSVQHCVKEPCEVPDMLCHTAFPPLPVSPRPVPVPAPRPAPAPTPRPAPAPAPRQAPAHAPWPASVAAPRPAPAPTPRPASASSSGPNGEYTLHSPCGNQGKEKDYSKHDLRYKVASDGMQYVQDKDDPLSNMWPVELHWDKYIFSSSEHIYVYELLKFHDQLKRNITNMIKLSHRFSCKKLGRKLEPQHSMSWSEKCVSKMYSILQAKWSQSKASVLALLDANEEILYILPNGHRDLFWAYPGANKHGYLLKQLWNSKVRNCTYSPISNRQSITNSTIRKVQGCSSSVISNKHSGAVTSVSKVGDSTNSPIINRQSVTGTSVCKVRDCTSFPIANQYSAKDKSNSKITTDSASSLDNSNTEQYGGNSDNAQVYIVRTEVKSKYSNTEIIQTLQNPDENKLSHAMPVKPKGGEVYVLDWQGDESKLKDYVADQYVWVADCAKLTTHSGV